jgi:predicted GNAT family N-acyltransferase
MLQPNRSQLRKLLISDIPSAVGLSAEAGWNQTNEDWHLLIDLAAENCFAIELDGELAATTTLLCYGRRLGWIGMVLTKRCYRGRGFARRLLTTALRRADQMGIETVKLDATDQGRPLYEGMGFRFEQPVERWTRTGSGDVPEAIVAVNDIPLAGIWEGADRSAFGVERVELLRRLAKRGRPAFFHGCSYLLTRSGRQTAYLGPCVCESPDIARSLIDRALQTRTNGGWSWDLLPKHTSAVAIAQDLGFAPTRGLQRMLRGRDLHSKEESIYAIAGFELG